MNVSRPALLVLKSFVAATLVAGVLVAQEEDSQPQGVVIEAAALSLKSQESYQASIQLRPVRSLPVVAPMDGIVQEVFVKVSDRVKEQAELLRLNSQELSLELKKVQALHEVAKIALAQATNDLQKQLLTAKLEVAKRDLDLAQFRAGQTILCAAMNGQIQEVYVTKGQFIRAGDLLATVIDPTQLTVDIPVERDLVEPDKTISITIEGQSTDGTVAAILPPLPKFDPLRELFLSVATARVTIDSQGGKFSPGQSVAATMIPRHPVAEIQSVAIRTATDDPDAERMVQVIREGFVRTLPIQLLGQVGETHVFVSARFAPQDELIVTTSEPLADGSWVRPMLVADENTPRTAPSRTPTRARPATFLEFPRRRWQAIFSIGQYSNGR